MRRDMDLVREILRFAADAEVSPLDARTLADEENDFQKVAYHVKIMKDAGLVEATIAKGSSGLYSLASIDSLTWEGQDLLGAISNRRVWKNVKAKVAKYAGDVTLDILKRLASQELDGLFPS